MNENTETFDMKLILKDLLSMDSDMRAGLDDGLPQVLNVIDSADLTDMATNAFLLVTTSVGAFQLTIKKVA